ncbi:MAG: Crp/Fnr family transcriptional regulator [Pseudomonadota bacterium]
MTGTPSSLAGVSAHAQINSFCSTCAVRHRSLCSALSADEIADLNAIARKTFLPAGTTFVFEGDSSRDFATITSGVAKLVRGSEDGRSQIVGLLFASDFMGRVPGFSRGAGERNSIIAVSDLELCLFPRNSFIKLLEKYPSLEHVLLQQCLDELKLAREWMVILGRKTAGERVASFLLHVARKIQAQGDQGGTAFELPLARSDIADYIGLTVETVSRQISKLRRDGVIELTGSKHVTHVDISELKARAGFQ